MPERVIYLASGSPRRRELVRSLGIPVIAGLAPFDEDAAAAAYSGDPRHLAEYLARAKAEATLRARSSELSAGALVLAADTTVLLDDSSLAKPADDGDARRMLALLRDRTHLVVTGVALGRIGHDSAAPGERASTHTHAVRSLSVTTRVTMRAYSDAEVAAYIASGDPRDKAGAYAIQHAGFRPVAAIAGCYLAVVGLPLCALSYLLALADDAPTHDTARFEAQRALAESGTCPWSAECRAPFACWPASGPPRAGRAAG